MAQSTPTKHEIVMQFATTASGVATFDIPTTTDQVHRIEVYCIASSATASHLTAGGSWVGQYVVENKNGVLSAPIVVGSSINPANFSNLQTSNAEAADSTFNSTTGAWSISGTNARLTVSLINGTGGQSQGNITCWFTVWRVGST